jgi:hypothetical protein
MRLSQQLLQVFKILHHWELMTINKRDSDALSGFLPMLACPDDLVWIDELLFIGPTLTQNYKVCHSADDINGRCHLANEMQSDIRVQV